MRFDQPHVPKATQAGAVTGVQTKVMWLEQTFSTGKERKEGQG